MAIDRGGLNYTIKVIDEFARPLGRFRQDVQAARESYASLKRELSTPLPANAGVANEINKVATANEAATKTTTRRTAAVRELTRQEQTQKRSLQELNREARRREVNERKALDSSRRNFRFQRQVNSVTRARVEAEEQVTRAINRRAAVQERLRVLQARGLENDRELRKALGLQTEAEKRLERQQRSRANAVERLRQAQALESNQRLLQIRAEAAALDRINRARIAEQRDEALRRAGRADLIPGAGRASRGGITQPPEQSVNFFQRLARTVGDADNRANRASFTFRRLFGILAAFTLARSALAGFQGLIRNLISTSAAIETAEIGLSGLIVAVGEVRDINGQLLDAEEAIVATQSEARRQLSLLRTEALFTTASFEELADAFQIALGPGLAAGLELDEIRQFTVLISQAASAIGLEQRQLAEEVRSILSGTIRVTQTRIAAVLGIDNEDIRRAKEAGELFEFLSGELQAFALSGALAARTFTGLSRRLSDGISLVLREGGIGFFEELKGFLEDAVDSIATIDEVSGEIELNPEYVEAVELLSAGLTESVRTFRDALASIGTGGLQEIAAFTGAAIASLSEVLAALGLGLVDGLRDLGLLFGAIANAVRELTGLDLFDTATLSETIRVLTRILTVLISVRIVFGALGGLFVFLLSPLQTLVGLIASLGVGVVKLASATSKLLAAKAGLQITSGTLIGTFLALAAAIGAVTFAVTQLVGVTNFDLSRTPLINSIALRLDQAGAIGLAVRDFFSPDFSKTIEDIDRDLTKRLDEAEKNFDARVETAESLGDALRRNFEELFESFRAFATQASDSISGDVGRIIEDSRRVAEIDAIINPLSSALNSLIEDINGVADEYENLVEVVNGQRFQSLGLVSSVDLAPIPEADELNRILSLVQNTFTQLGEAQRSATRELANYRRQAESLRETLADITDESQRAEALGRIRAAEESAARLESLQTTQAALRVGLLGREISELLRLESVQKSRAAIEQSITNNAERAAFLAERTGNQAQLRVALAQNELDLVSLQADKTFSLQFAEGQRLAALRSVLEQQAQQLEAQEDLTDNERQALANIREAEAALGRRIDLLEREKVLQAELLDIQFERANREIALAIAARDYPVQTGIAVAAWERLVNLQDVFAQTQQIVGNAIDSFASTMSSLVVDIFDPGKDASIRERFGRFLQGIAQQILSTLISLAVTAIVLNAASGGILSGLFGPLNAANDAGGFGAAEGGRMDDKVRRRARAHPAHFHRAKGRNKGGTGARPKGLHPSDTIPIWVAKNEWVVRASSVAKAGHDALARINSGMFEPGALRSALGLEGPAKAAVSMATKGPGMISGGRVRSAAAIQGGGSSPAGPTVAIIAPTEEASRRLFTGSGRAALLDAIGDDAAEIRARLDL